MLRAALTCRWAIEANSLRNLCFRRVGKTPNSTRGREPARDPGSRLRLRTHVVPRSDCLHRPRGICSCCVLVYRMSLWPFTSTAVVTADRGQDLRPQEQEQEQGRPGLRRLFINLHLSVFTKFARTRERPTSSLSPPYVASRCAVVLALRQWHFIDESPPWFFNVSPGLFLEGGGGRGEGSRR